VASVTKAFTLKGVQTIGHPTSQPARIGLSTVSKFMGGDTQTHRQDEDRIRQLSFFVIRKVG
jgi:hypothetical protein